MLKGTRREFFTEQCEEHQCRLLIFFSVKTTNSRKNNRDKKLYGVQLIYCCLCRCSPCRYTYTQLLQISNHMSLITVCTNSDVHNTNAFGRHDVCSKPSAAARFKRKFRVADCIFRASKSCAVMTYLPLSS